MARQVLVTGGGTGIGKAIAAAFVAEGDEVVLIGRRRDVLDAAVRDLGSGARAVRCDLSCPADVACALTRLPESVDVLVNNAGGRDRRPGEDLLDVYERWLADYRGNVLTAVLITTALEPRLRAPGGRIITISSVAALRGNGSYGAAKAALHAWNHTLAGRLAPRGITANVVVPGFVTGTEFFGDGGEGELGRRAAATLVGRVGTPQDVARCVTFLAAPEADYLTGEFLNVNGGVVLGR